MANTTNQNGTPYDPQKEFYELQLAKLKRDLAEDEQRKLAEKVTADRRKKNAETEAMYAKESEAAKKRKQEGCPHMAKDTSFVRGQRLGNAKDKDGNERAGFLAFCQICLKEYDSWDSIPDHLRSDANYFGGPRNY